MSTRQRIAIVASAVVMLVGFGIAGADETQPAGKAAGTQAVKKQTVCPVMGGTVNTNLYVDYEGKRIYVCCKGCVADVKKDPAKYISKLEKDGVTLDKAPAADPAKKSETDAEAAPSKGHDHSGKGGGCM